MSVNPVTQKLKQLLLEKKYQQALQLAQQNGLTQTAQKIQAIIYIQQAINDAENGNINQALTDLQNAQKLDPEICLLYTSPSPRDRQKYRMPSSA